MVYALLATIAAVGLLASIACHIMGWLQIEPPGGKAVYLLHIGVFVVWVPFVLLSNRTKPKSGRNNINHVLAELPKWARVTLGILAAYLVLNFVYFIYCTQKYPKHGVPPSVELRGFSGHWIAFYGVALAGFIGLGRLDRKPRDAKTFLEVREIESHKDHPELPDPS